MKSSIFQDAVESSTKVIGRKTTVSVVFEGGSAHTDGDTVYIPALPPAAEVTTEQADCIRGYRDHESMHVRCTDTSKPIMDRLQNMTQSNSDLGALVQFCEDVRIENAGVQEYAGMKHTLSAVNSRVAKKLVEQLAGAGKPEDVFVSLPKPIQFRAVLGTLGRMKIGVHHDDVLNGLMDAAKANSPEMYALAEKWSDAMVKLPTGMTNKGINEAESRKGTTLAMNLAETIHGAWEQFEKDNTPPPPPPPAQNDKPSDEETDDDCSGQAQGSGQGDGDSTNGQGSGGSGDDASTGEDEDDNQGGEQQDDGAQPPDVNPGGDGNGGGSSGSEQGEGTSPTSGGEGESTETGEGGGHGSHQVIVSKEDQAAVEKLLNDGLKAGLDSVVQEMDDSPTEHGQPKARRFLALTNKFSQRLPAKDALLAANSISMQDSVELRRTLRQAGQQFQAIEQSVSGKRAMIRRLLELELQARSDRRWQSGFGSGRLPSVRIVDAITGRDNVYQQRHEGKDMNTLLHIGIDGSGSMVGGYMLPSMTLAFALSEALERTGCDVSVSIWGNVSVTTRQSKHAKYSSVELNAFSKQHKLDSHGRYNHGYGGSFDAGKRFASSGLITHAVVKEKRQRCSDPVVKEAFGLGVHSMRSSTPSYQAVFDDLRMMASEQHAKKIYLHITDGDPDRLPPGFTQESLVKEMHDYAAGVNVHMIGVGIGGCNVSHLFRDALIVTGADAYEPVIRKLAKMVAEESGHAAGFKRAA